MANTYTLDVEIFAVGTWNGYSFGKEDLIEMAVNFHALTDYHQVPLKFGHNDEQPFTDGQPSLGWVSDVKVDGTKLIATFVDVPEIVYNAMEAKLYRNVSIELDMGVEHKGSYYGWVLSGVALLGADIPAVNTLADLQAYMGRTEHSSNGDELSFKKRIAFTAISVEKIERSNVMSDETIEQELATLKLKYTALETEHGKVVQENLELKTERTELRAKFSNLEAGEKTRKETENRKVLETRLEVMVTEKKIAPFTRDDYLADYDEADDKGPVLYSVDKMEKTINANPAYFGAEQARKKSNQEREEGDLSADQIVVERTNEYMVQFGEKSFSAAKTAVLRADKALAERYTKGL